MFHENQKPGWVKTFADANKSMFETARDKMQDQGFHAQSHSCAGLAAFTAPRCVIAQWHISPMLATDGFLFC